MADFPDFASLSNLELIEEMYSRYKGDPNSVDASWRYFFQGMGFSKFLEARGGSEKECRVLRLIDAYRRYGHLIAPKNPLGPLRPEPSELQMVEQEQGVFPTFGFLGSAEASLGEIAEGLRQIYGSRIGFEYMGTCEEIEKWMQGKLEPRLVIEPTDEERRFLADALNRAESFEMFLHTKYVGQKRFSIEGAETLIPVMSELIAHGAELGMEEFVIGMAHRGRLNVLSNLLQKNYSVIFEEFEDSSLPQELEGSGDVKYHKGFSADVTTRFGKKVHLHLAANSSCLESVDPIVLGLTRAKQMGFAGGDQKAGAILVHGDASVSGQGIVYEVLEMMRLEGYCTGGTIHVVVNNQIGFTTLPEESRSTRYCTDIAKTFGCPVFHVNAEDPESCLFAAKMALELRLKFKVDVFIDLLCYRKYGHNEGDEPAFTQPLQYKTIRSKESIRQMYLKSLPNALANQEEEKFRSVLENALAQARSKSGFEPEMRFGAHWKGFSQPKAESLFEACDTKVARARLQQVVDGYCQIPVHFHLHPKLQKWVGDRKSLNSIDWGLAECLAFGSLLQQKIAIRLGGQDCRRGTFSQRHAVWVDQENGSLYFPFAHIAQDQAVFEVYNSPLSEFGCLGFEFGYSWGDLKSLVIWEAQYGDFAIGAQTIIDHYITTAEQKWARYSNLVVLLPHGYEGQGPEHSSARIERFLQLAANNNVQICNLSTPAQYFHVLRRQMLREIKKPLIIFTPKSLLRLSQCVSAVDDLSEGGFEELIDDRIDRPRALLLCSGRIYYELLEERQKRGRQDVAIVRVEQLYPLHMGKMKSVLERYKKVADVCWVQDEPENMGAWEFLAPSLRMFFPEVRYAGRKRSPATATGSHKQHVLEQQQLISEAFR